MNLHPIRWIPTLILGLLFMGSAQAAEATPEVKGQVLTGVFQVGTGIAPVESWNLKGFRKELKADAGPIDFEKVTNERASDQILLSFDTGDFLYLYDKKGVLTAQGDTSVWTYEDANIKIVRKITANPEKPYAEMEFKIDFKTAKRPGEAYLTLKTTGHDGAEHVDQQLDYFANQEITRIHADSLNPDKESQKPEKKIDGTEIAGPVKWVGVLNRYFLLALVPQTPAGAFLQPVGYKKGTLSLSYPITGNSLSVPVRVYFGPKDLELLRKTEPTLDHAVDFGWFTIIAYPILRLLRWLYGFFHNYGISIILLTLLLKICTFPLTYKSAKGMGQMAKLQPQIQRIREKYKDDRETLNREMLAVMKGSGANPMAGCFPVVIQMPVFFALYRVLYNAVELYQAPFTLWIQDLSAKDPLYVTPILLTLVMFLQQKLTPTSATADPAQQKMMQFMPVIFGAMMIALPAGLTLYMLVNALFSIFQQLWINKKLGTGRYAKAVVAQA